MSAPVHVPPIPTPRTIAVVTGTRAEYGLLKRLIARIHAAPETELKLIPCAAHLSPDHGHTVSEIEADGFPIADRVEMLLSSDSAAGVTKATGLGMIGFADAFARLRPDLVVVLGDRFEILAAASAALFAAIPVAHINGGETTEGAFDEAVRHAVTKIAHLHFPAAAPYAERIVQLGEDPARVFDVGGLGVDAILALDPISREALEADLGFAFGEKSLLVTFHPATVEGEDPRPQMQALLNALDRHPDIGLLFTLPNADSGGRALAAMVEDYAAQREGAVVHASLGQRRYFSALRQVSGVIGNSSSGLAEAPSFGIGTINIGDRQQGRLRAASVIDVSADAQAIDAAINQLFSSHFQASLPHARNPYGKGGAADAIFEIISTHPLSGLLKKRFHDLAPTKGHTP